jgi:hypothetical protein
METKMRKEKNMNYEMVSGEIDKRTPTQRLADLQSYLDEEKSQPNPSAVYIEDLELSIKRLKRQMGIV